MKLDELIKEIQDLKKKERELEYFKKAIEENDYREKCRFWIKEEELIEKGDDDCE